VKCISTEFADEDFFDRSAGFSKPTAGRVECRARLVLDWFSWECFYYALSGGNNLREKAVVSHVDSAANKKGA
jgi:hypothetical protein